VQHSGSAAHVDEEDVGGGEAHGASPNTVWPWLLCSACAHGVAVLVFIDAEWFLQVAFNKIQQELDDWQQQRKLCGSRAAATTATTAFRVFIASGAAGTAFPSREEPTCSL